MQYRIVYQRSLLRIPGVLEHIETAFGLGEEARLHADVPIRVNIADDAVALVILPHPQDEGEAMALHNMDGLLVRSSPFLDVLVRIFDSYWTRATPFSALTRQGKAPALDSKNILSLLAAGMNDAAVARTLGVSERTVRRRIANLERKLGANSRFTLGIEASRQGLV